MSPGRPHALASLEARLAALEAEGRRRRRAPLHAASSLRLCSNDYLGYATGGLVPMPDGARGAGASRLVAGTFPEHEALEADVAAWLGHEDALVFASGYAANLGLVSALAGPDDVVVSDALNHASIIDGCRLARTRTVVVPHGDVDAVSRALAGHAGAANRYVVTEGYFSMDGDVPDLAGLRRACDDHGAALIVDDAHALGVLGPEGRGACAAAGVVPDVIVGTFGKALGGQGAFVAGPRLLTDWLWNRARSFVFSTALSPLLAAHARAAIGMARADDAARARVHTLGVRLRSGLRELGYAVPSASVGPIVPVLIGREDDTMRLSAALAEQGVLVTGIRPPTVPAGTSRLRVTVHAGLSDDDLDRALAAFRAARAVLATG